MNPGMARLQPYPFERLAGLLRGLPPAPQHPPIDFSPIDFSIGEPKHQAPDFVRQALIDNLRGLSRYPKTAGTPPLLDSIADWLTRRFHLTRRPDPATRILPLNGTREGLFAIAQCLLDASAGGLVVLPNPFYQIYEGAALLAGATPFYLPLDADRDFTVNLDAVSAETWQQTRLLYLCSPANPTGGVLGIEQLARAVELAKRHNFVIVSDECYSELYLDEARPPAGLLQACELTGDFDYQNCLVFHSLSKRSSLPGLRSGFVAGEARLINAFLRYRTYHGSAMPEQVQAASAAAWQDERHVIDNRRLYREKFLRAGRILADVGGVRIPPGGFYLWFPTHGNDEQFCRDLYQRMNVLVLPGSYLGRLDGHRNPGEGYVRIALVAAEDDCAEGIARIRDFLRGGCRQPPLSPALRGDQPSKGTS